MSPTTTPTPTRIGALGAATAVACWGVGNSIIARTPLDGVAVAVHRLWLGSLLYLVIFFATGGRLSLGMFRRGAAGAAAYALDVLVFYYAVKNTSVAGAVTINALQPIVILFFAAAMFGEKVRSRHLVATVVALGGILLVVRGTASDVVSTWQGNLAAVVALGLWSWYFIASKSARRHLDTMEYMTVVMVLGFVIAFPVGVVSGQLFDPSNALTPETLGWVSLVVLLPGSGHVLMNWAHAHTTLLTTSLLTLLMPAISAISGIWLLSQDVTGVQWLGILVVLGALAAVIVADTRDLPTLPAEDATTI